MIDEQVAARAAGGDQQALEQLCRQTWRQLYGFVYHKVQNREEAEDVTQEAYSRTMRALPRDFSAGSFMSYLQTVASNIIRDRWRRGKVRGQSLPLDDDTVATDDPSEGVADRDLVARALQSLSADYRTVIELRILKGLTTAEAARQMSRSEGAIRTLQYRAIQALREAIS
ncbi:MAG TPA: RNA polymerase sigma factor [Symbiobacteriaceae bacterium]|nr:RNA polymerase sigma factor [Symbiobacteriaceae bacterium]